MQCSHCLANATPDGEEMSVRTFTAAIRFIQQFYPIVLISGGEPTEHSTLIELLDMARNAGMYVILLSNGEFLHNKAPKRRDRILKLVQAVQVTNDPRFYPRHVEHFAHPKVLWETNLRVVSPQGRAATNGLPTNRRYPDCFNLHSVSRAMGFAYAVPWLRNRGKFCTPSINIDGSLSAGESPFCKKIGYVTDSLDTIDHNIELMHCQRCGLVNNLNEEQRRAID